MSNILKAYLRFKDFERLFRCPICTADMAFENQNSLVCSNNHCFDLSKYGYVNFTPKQSKAKYTKDLFECRRTIFQAGFYDPLLGEMKRLLNKYAYMGAPYPVYLLDAGCGEGFFTKRLSEDDALKEIFALDISKDAVLFAAKEKGNDIKWLIGDVASIPLRSSSVDILLNIFTPANYNEFLRVMSDEAIMIKIIPGKKYLQELRECAGGQLIKQEYSNEDVLQVFYRNMNCIDKRQLFYQLPLTQYHLKNLIGMTPLMFNVDKTAMNTGDIRQITIDVEILTGKK